MLPPDTRCVFLSSKSIFIYTRTSNLRSEEEHVLRQSWTMGKNLSISGPWVRSRLAGLYIRIKSFARRVIRTLKIEAKII